MKESKYALLQRCFGYSSFRGGQEELIDGVLSGRDVLGVMPTGGGKSLCYQIPALLFEGLTVVVSPLISLMKDQVMALKSAGLPAAYLNSSLTSEQIGQVYRNLRAGRYKLLYVAPERLLAEGFVALLQDMDVAMVAVDEAHCISQWGQDFRPSYLKIADFISRLPRRPVVSAFTATATPRVQQDIAQALELRDPVWVVTGFDRPNLRFEVRRSAHKLTELKGLVSARGGKSGIIYCATRKDVEKVCQALRDVGVPATRYHAGLEDGERQSSQEDFIYDRAPVMVATNAFGMGIDKSNVAFVIHYNMPKSLEAYYQEAGRAGRDGSEAECILLFSSADIVTAKYLIQNTTENEELTEAEREAVIAQDLRRLEQMVGYCRTEDCLRGYLLDYFGQAHPPRCGNCGNCDADVETRDITRQAQMILSCVQRIIDRLGYSVGIALVTRTLRGGGDKRLLSLGLDKLSTYGLMRQLSRGEVTELTECLVGQGYLYQDPQYGALTVTAKGREVLFHGARVEMRVKAAPPEPEKERRTQEKRPQAEDEGLMDRLRALRSRLAREENVPAYVVFSNATLADMTRKMPRTMEELLTVSGVGAVKAERYGKIFLRELEEYQRGE